MDRIRRYMNVSSCGENINFGSETGEEVVISLIVDDGVPNRPHRKNMLNPDFTMVGIACGPHKVHHHCTVLDYSSDPLPLAELLNQKSTDSVQIEEPVPRLQFDKRPVNKNPLSIELLKTATPLPKVSSPTADNLKTGTFTQAKFFVSPISPVVNLNKAFLRNCFSNDPLISQKLVKPQGGGFGGNVVKTPHGNGPSGGFGMASKTKTAMENGNETPKIATTYQFADGSKKEHTKQAKEIP